MSRTWTRIDPPFHLWVPKFNDYGLAHFMLDEGIEEDVYWMCFMQNTGEICSRRAHRPIKTLKIALPNASVSRDTYGIAAVSSVSKAKKNQWTNIRWFFSLPP